MEEGTIRLEQEIQQIADMLLLHGTLTECPGLIHGKMGIAVFFFHYYQYTGNELFEDYAFDLIGEIKNQIHANTPADYENGIAGIGTGIGYLMCNKFLNVAGNVFDDFDSRMYRAVMYDPWKDFSLFDGLCGLGRYWASRLRQQSTLEAARKCLNYIVEKIEDKLSEIDFDDQAEVYCFLLDLQLISGFESCMKLLEKCWITWGLQSMDVLRCFPRLGDSGVGNIVRKYQCGRYFNDELHVDIERIPVLDMGKAPVSTGFLNGYAGDGMLRLTVLNQMDISWMNLL